MSNHINPFLSQLYGEPTHHEEGKNPSESFRLVVEKVNAMRQKFKKIRDGADQEHMTESYRYSEARRKLLKDHGVDYNKTGD